MAVPTFDRYWHYLGLPEKTYPPERIFLVPIEARELEDCVPLAGAAPEEELIAARAFGRPEVPKGSRPVRRPADRDRRFARVDLVRPVRHPMWRSLVHPLTRLPVFPAGLRESPPPGERAVAFTALDASYVRLLRANAALARYRREDGPDEFRAMYGELDAAVRSVLVGDGGSLLAAFGASPAERWQRIVALAVRADRNDFDPVWADDLETHTTLALLAGLGFRVETRP